MVDGIERCWAKPNGKFAMECVQGQIKWKVHPPQSDLKGWARTLKLVPIQWTSSHGEVCPNLYIFTKLHFVERYAQKMAFLHASRHFIKEWSPCNMPWNNEGYKVHGSWLHAQKGGNTTSLTTHNEGEHQKCNANCKWPKEGPKEEVG